MLSSKDRLVKKAVIIAINLCLLGLFLLNVTTSAMNVSNSKPSEFPVNSLEFASNPTYDYSYKENLAINYTYFGNFSLAANQTVTFETAKSGSNPDIDTEMYLFKYPAADASTSWYNDNYNGYYSRISVTVPTAGPYCLMIRGSGEATGYASLYKDGPLVKGSIQIGGKCVTTSMTKTGMLNYFTANGNGTNTVLWLVDGSGHVLAMNNDYFGFGSYSWGSSSRVRASLPSNIAYAVVGTYSLGSTGTTDVYLQCNDGFTNSSIFPNLYADDSIKAGIATDTYNCIAWSGGITNAWIWPNYVDVPGGGISPWYNSNKITALDNYYGNNPPRYSGALTYVNTANSSESVIDVWANSPSNYTHASVRKPAHNIPHGYDWESKLGSAQRIFHPRSALSGADYGNIVRYYKPATGSAMASSDIPGVKSDLTGTRVIAPTGTQLLQYQGDSGMTFEKSVAAGLTTTQKITLSSETLAKLEQMKNAAGSNVADRFQWLYQKWVSAVQASPQMMLSSNPYDYLKIYEYRPLEALLRSQGKAAWGLLLDNYLQEKNIYARTLVAVFVVGYDKNTVALVDKIRERNNQISRNSLASKVYIAPTYETNLMCFINEIMNPSSGR